MNFFSRPIIFLILINMLSCSTVIIDPRVNMSGKKEYNYQPNEKYCNQVIKIHRDFYESLSKFSSTAYNNILECSQNKKSDELAEPAYVYSRKLHDIKDFFPKDANIYEISSCFHGPYNYDFYSSDIMESYKLIARLINACSIKFEKKVLDKFYLSGPKENEKPAVKLDDLSKILQKEIEFQ